MKKNECHVPFRLNYVSDGRYWSKYEPCVSLSKAPDDLLQITYWEYNETAFSKFFYRRVSEIFFQWFFLKPITSVPNIPKFNLHLTMKWNTKRTNNEPETELNLLLLQAPVSNVHHQVYSTVYFMGRKIFCTSNGEMLRRGDFFFCTHYTNVSPNVNTQVIDMMENCQKLFPNTTVNRACRFYSSERHVTDRCTLAVRRLPWRKWEHPSRYFCFFLSSKYTMQMFYLCLGTSLNSC